MLRLNRKHLDIKRYEVFMLACVVVATLARFVLIYYNWPTTNSDEGNMGILARHVAYNGEWPIFFYGLPYMGPLEGYIAAPLFHFFSPSLLTLRVALLAFFALFLICMYYLTRMLYTPGLALAIVVLLSFGSSSMILNQLKAVGEYPETEFFAAFISLLVIWLALSSHTLHEQARTTRRRVLSYGVLGLIVGLALWVDFLILPFVATGVVFLLLFCRRELRSWAGVSLGLGMIIGSFPLIIYNVTAPLDKNSFNILLDIHQSGAGQLVGISNVMLRRLVGTLIVSLPNATGYNPLCSLDTMPYFGTPHMDCILLQGAWGLAYLLLWGLAGVMIGRALWRKGPWQRRHDWTFEEKQQVIRQCGRLMLWICAGGTLFLYAISPDPVLVPMPTARYLICMLVALPVVLYPLWRGLPPLEKLFPRLNVHVKPMLIMRIGVLLFIALIYVLGTYRTFQEIPDAQAHYQQQGALVQHLLKLKATRVYSEYWTCNNLTFRSNEHIICSALDEQLGPGFNRYALYATEVKTSSHPAYVFPRDSKQASVLSSRIPNLNTAYRRADFGNYVIYVPIAQ
jgi:hypothetical protein